MSLVGPLDIMRSRVMSGLESGLNFLMLNTLLLLSCLLVVTAPLAVHAATSALVRWRSDGEGRVVGEFFAALRRANAVRTTVVIGVPLLGAGLAVEEVHYFVQNDRNAMGQVCLGLGVAALIIVVIGLGYALLLEARFPSAAAWDVWWASMQFGLRNLFVTGPLFLGEITMAAVVLMIDPALVLLGVPIVLLNVLRATAERGARRVGNSVSGDRTRVLSGGGRS